MYNRIKPVLFRRYYLRFEETIKYLDKANTSFFHYAIRQFIDVKDSPDLAPRSPAAGTADRVHLLGFLPSLRTRALITIENILIDFDFNGTRVRANQTINCVMDT